MSMMNRSVAAIVMLSFLCVSLTGQQPLTQQQSRHVKKVMNSLAHYDEGIRLDVLLNNGAHELGTLSQTGPTSFDLLDPVTHHPQTIAYLDVKRIRPNQRDYAAQQRGNATSVFTICAVGVAAFVTVALVLFVTTGDR